MTTTQPPAGPVEPPEPPEPPAAKTPKRIAALNAYYIAIAALLVGAATGAILVTMSMQPQIEEARAQRDWFKKLRIDAEEEASQAKEEKQRALEDFQTRRAELETKSADLAERESKIVAAEQQQAANEMTGGLHTVGTTVTAGTYTTTVTSGMCYYAWKTGTGSDASIVDNNIVEEGPATVTLEDGQIFETKGCGTWMKQ